MMKQRIYAINTQQIARLENERTAKVARYAKKKGISIVQAKQQLAAPVKIRRKSELDNTRIPNKHLTSSLYLSKSKSVWSYNS